MLFSHDYQKQTKLSFSLYENTGKCEPEIHIGIEKDAVQRRLRGNDFSQDTIKDFVAKKCVMLTIYNTTEWIQQHNKIIITSSFYVS